MFRRLNQTYHEARVMSGVEGRNAAGSGNDQQNPGGDRAEAKPRKQDPRFPLPEWTKERKAPAIVAAAIALAFLERRLDGIGNPSDIIGIVVGTLGVHRYAEAIRTLKQLIAGMYTFTYSPQAGRMPRQIGNIGG